MNALLRYRRTDGFTLIELLVVMGVIALLMALLVPTIGKIREQVSISRVTATIKSISLALEQYKSVNHCYPPDEHPQLARSSQCLVYYLSGASIYYDTSMANYPWTHDVYKSTGGGAGRNDIEDYPVYQEFEPAQFKDFGDHAPVLVDPWRHPLIYNAPGRRYGNPKHGERKYDIFSTGPDGVYGTEDDVVNWRDRLEWGYDSYGLNDGTH